MSFHPCKIEHGRYSHGGELLLRINLQEQNVDKIVSLHCTVREAVGDKSDH